MGDSSTLKHEYREINGVRLHCVVAGSGRLVVLLHGFPEFWYSYREQIPVLAQHFTVVAPDMRGYNLSSKPVRITDYVIPTLVEDVVQLIHSFGAEQAHIVGHDWGGIIAWATALNRPDVTTSLSVMNAPHPRIFSQNLLTNRRQVARSWYIGLFQLPWLPEFVIRARNYEFIERAFRGMGVHKEQYTPDVIAAYKAAMAQPGAAGAAVNYYRAIGRPASQRAFTAANPVATMPVQVIWGEHDTALGKELNEGLERYVPDLTLHFIPDASHWVQQDRPDLVNQYLLEFLLR
ncbi:MAG: alpha/beta hydrolase [Herpetosiphonaceae bacterium]|nr:alpha/beta hydrolase [Herpetosiphonaceae bacterium]